MKTFSKNPFPFVTFTTLEVTFSKQKVHLSIRCQIEGIVDAQLYFMVRKGHEVFFWQKLTFNFANFRWKFLALLPINSQFLPKKNFVTFPKPYSKVAYRRCHQFGTLLINVPFVLKKLPLK